MEVEEAYRIMELLTNGINPDTGSPLPKKSPYNSPRVMRALFLAMHEMKAQSSETLNTAAFQNPAEPVETATGAETPAAEKTPNPRYPNQGKPWTEDEDEQLRGEYTHQKLSVGQIASQHQRSWSGIAYRLVALELVHSVDDLKSTPIVADEH